MAEAVGLVLSGVSLATIFSTCLDCFERIHTGRNFGKDYEEYVLKISILRRRFSRWSQRAKPYDWNFVPSMEKYHAKRLMEQIHTTFEEVECQMKKIQPRATESSTDVESADRIEVLQASETKTKWALYNRDQGDKLIRRLTECIDGLFELVPSSMPQQSFQCDNDLREIMARDGKEVVTTIGDAAPGVGNELGRSIERAAEADAQLVEEWKEQESTGHSTQHNGSVFEGALPEGFKNVHSTWTKQVSKENSTQHNGSKFVNGKRV